MAPSALAPRLRKLEDRLLLSATPEAAVEDLPEEALMNQDVSFTVAFDNTAAVGDADATGYSPFFDLTAEPGAAVTGASYVGRPVALREVAVWDGTDWVDAAGTPVTRHPLDREGGPLELPAGTLAGQTWFLLELPFGSYGPDQPALPITVTASLDESADPATPEAGAVPGQPIEITARGGFRFGLDALDNPSVDPPVQQTAASVDTITPTVLRIAKGVDLPEGETAQGPNFEFDWVITVDVADGVTLTDVTVSDLLPDNLFFLGAETDVAGAVIDAPGENGRPAGIPGLDTGTAASFGFASITGAPGADVTIRLTAYAPQTDAAGDPLIETAAPARVPSVNEAAATGEYLGIPVDGTISGSLEDAATAAIRPFTVQKSVGVEGGGPALPGKFLRFEVDVAVSDFQSIDELVLTDVLADGLRFDTTDDAVLEHRPLLRVEQDGAAPQVFALERLSLPGREDEIDVRILPGDDPDAPFGEEVTFRLSAAERNGGGDGTFSGDLWQGDPQEGATRLTLIYFAEIEERYREPGRGPLVLNETLSNSVEAEALTSDGLGPAEGDGSSAGVALPRPQAEKSVYAVDGVVGAPAVIAPGDLVTYRLRVELGSADLVNLTLDDFLPQPVFDVDDGGSFAFDPDAVGPPPAFGVARGPDDTLTGPGRLGGTPSIAVNGAANALRFAFEDFDEGDSGGGVIDLLYTVEAEDRPFADGVRLVNQALVSTGDSRDPVVSETISIGEVILRQPVLSLTKGVVATDGDGGATGTTAFSPGRIGPDEIAFELAPPPGGPAFTVSAPLTTALLEADPIASDLVDVDAGDRVRFALTVLNTGGKDAFDVVIADTLPTVDIDGDGAPDPGRGLALPPEGLRLEVRYGDGTLIPEDQTGAAPFSWSGDLFSGGIEIADDGVGGVGALAADGADDGRNVIVVSYALVLEEDFAPAVAAENTAELVAFASVEGGTDFTDGVEGPFEDDASVSSPGLGLAKRVTATSEDLTPGRDASIPGGDGVTIGEVATYQLEVTLPEGRSDLVIEDRLPRGFAIWDAGFGGDGAPVLRTAFTDAAGAAQTFDGAVVQTEGGPALGDGAALAFSVSGRDLTIRLAGVSPAAGAGTADQTFAIVYRLIATDDAAGNGDPLLEAGDRPRNNAVAGSETAPDTESARARVRVQEPDLSVEKRFTPNVVEGGPGSLTQLELVVSNADRASVSPAFGLVLVDPDLSKDLIASFGPVTLASDDAAVQARIDAGEVTVTLIDVTAENRFELRVTGDETFFLDRGESLRVTADLIVNPTVAAGASLTNTAEIPAGGYSSLPGLQPVERLYGPEEATDVLSVVEPGVDKSVISTSLFGDDDPEVSIGELVRYRVDIDLPLGQVLDLAVLDDFAAAADPALREIVELVSVDAVTVGAALTLLDRPGGLTPGDFTLRDATGDGQADGFEIDIGDVDNSAGGVAPAGAQRIRIEFTGRVANAPEGRDGVEHSNLVTVSVRAPGPGGLRPLTLSDAETLTLREPEPSLTKTSDAPAGGVDAGDEVTFTLALDAGAAAAGAFELAIEDRLAPGLVLAPGSVTVAGGSADPARFKTLDAADVEISAGPGGTSILRIGAVGGSDGFDLAPGDAATITYRAVAAADVETGQALGGEARLTYASLPFVDPTDGEDPALLPGEGSGASARRDGSDVDFDAFDPADPPRGDPAIRNNFGTLAALDLDVRTPGPVVKTVDAPSHAIGEVIGYSIDVPLIEGATRGLVVTDDLPEGVAFVQSGASVADSLSVLDADGATLTIRDARIEVVGAAQRLVVELEDVSVAGDNDPSNDSLTLAFEGRVLNVAGNQDGVALQNEATATSATLDPDAPLLTRSGTAESVVVEPLLIVDKSVDVPAGFDAGDTATWTLEVRHAAGSSADAFDLALDDPLPADMAPGALLSARLDGVDVAAAFALGPAGLATVPGADLDLARGSVLRLVYTLTAEDAVRPGQSLSNAATTTWTSLDGELRPGAVDGERIGTPAPDVNDHLARAAASAVVEGTLTLDKAVDSAQTLFAVGERVPYALTVTLGEGTYAALSLTDGVAAGLALDPATLTVDAAGFGGAAPMIVDLTETVGPGGVRSVTFGLDNTPGTAAREVVNPGDGDAGNDGFVIRFEAVVVNRAEAAEGARLLNSALASADGVLSTSGAAEIEVAEPEILLTKSVVSPSGGVDAGDVVTYEAVLENTGRVTAYDAAFRDAPPAPLALVGAVSAVDGAGSPVAGVSVIGGAVVGEGLTLAPGERLVIRYDARVGEAIRPGEAIDNTADATWTSRPGDDPNERTGDDGPGGALDDHAATATARIEAAFGAALAKTLVSTDQGGDADPLVAVGERLTWRLDLSLTEGTTPGVVVTDTLDPGMAFIGDVVATAPPGATVAAPAVSVDAATGVVTFDFGDVVLPGADDTAGAPPDLRTISLSYVTQVLNAAANRDGQRLPNAAELTADDPALTASASAEAEVAEPRLALTKTNDATDPVEAGDTVVFTVTAAHAPGSRADAFEVTIDDRLVPDGLAIGRIVSATLGGLDVSAQFGFTGQALFTLPSADLDIALGETLTLVYEATVTDAVGPRQSLPNVVTARWTSIDGERAPGEIDGERDGSFSRPVNDHVAAAGSTVGTGGRIGLVKRVDAPDTLFAVGERVPYLLDVGVFEGTLRDVVVVDVVDPGVEVDLASLRVVDVGFAGAAPVISDVELRTGLPGGVSQLSFVLDNAPGTPGSQIVNPGNNDISDDTFRIAFEGLVVNALDNRDGRGVVNAAGVGAEDVDSATDTAGVTLTEPRIEIDKRIVSPAAGPVDAGDVVTYEVVLENVGTSTAFDAAFRDAAPANAVFLPDLTAVDAAGAPVAGFAVAPDRRALTGALDLAAGARVTLAYALRVEDAVGPAQDLPNLAEIDWTSTPGANPDERTGADGPGPDGTVLNNYAAADGALIATGPLAAGVAKTLADTSLAETSGRFLAVGEVATFSVRITLDEGTTPDLRLDDLLPAGLSLLPGSVTVMHETPGGSTGYVAGGESYDPATGALGIVLGRVVTPGDNDPANNAVEVRYRAVALDAAPVVDGAVLLNAATLSAGQTVLGAASATVEIVEPSLTLTKSLAEPVVGPGERALYTLEVAHDAASRVAAFDLLLSDPFDDPRLAFDPATATAEVLGPGGAARPATVIAEGDGFRVALDRLALDERLAIRVEAVASALPEDNGALAPNDAALVWDTLPDDPAPEEQRAYAESAAAALRIAGPDLRLTKTAEVAEAQPGDTFRYDLRVENVGAPGVDLPGVETARDVVLTDRLPDGLALVSAADGGVPATPTFGPDGRTFSLTLADLPPDTARLVTLVVRVDNPAAAVPDAGPTPDAFVNRAEVGFDGTDPTPANNRDGAVVDLIALPDLEIAKSSAVEATGGGEAVAYMLEVRNVGDRVASGVVVTDRVDLSVFEFVSAGQGGRFDAAGGTVVWTLDRLSPEDGTLALDLVLRVRGGLDGVESATNRAAAADDGAAGPDPTPDGNRAEETDRLLYPDLAITKANSVDEVAPGDVVDFAIVARNLGDFRADGVVVVDTVDAQVWRFVSASDGGVFDAEAGTVTWRLGTLAPGDAPVRLTLSLEARLGVDPSVEEATNTVRVDDDGSRGVDADPDNNEATTLDRLLPGIDPGELSRLFEERPGFFDVEEQDMDDGQLVAPVFTGAAPAGASVTVTLLGADGRVLAQAGVIASEDGGWMLTMPDLDLPAGEAEALRAMVVTAPPPVRAEDGNDTQVLYAAGGDAPILFTRDYDLYDARGSETGRAMEARGLAAREPGLASARRFVNYDAAESATLNGR